MSSTTTTVSFKLTCPFEKRRQLSTKILATYPDRVPVIVERAPKTTVPLIDRKKFLAPGDITVAKFISEIRKHIELSSDKSIFIFVGNNQMPPSASVMSQIYEKYADEDGFLYVMYSGENTFG